MAEHTPGPWTLHTTGSDGHGWVVQHPVDGAYRGVAQVRGSSRQAQANARLIAAAPDLLEACEWLLDRLANHYDDKERFERITADAQGAIAKAKGES